MNSRLSTSGVGRGRTWGSHVGHADDLPPTATGIHSGLLMQNAVEVDHLVIASTRDHMPHPSAWGFDIAHPPRD